MRVDSRLYNVDSETVQRYLDVPQKMIGLNGTYTVFVSMRDAVQNKSILADYYKTIVELAKRNGVNRGSLTDYFELGLDLGIPDPEKEGFVYPNFYRNYAAINSFFSWVKDSGERETWADMDQNWQFDGFRSEDIVYLKESYPDDDLPYDKNYIDDIGFNVALPLEMMIPAIAEEDKRAKEVIAYLTDIFGFDVWTLYPFYSYDASGDLTPAQLNAYSASYFAGLESAAIDKNATFTHSDLSFDTEHF